MVESTEDPNSPQKIIGMLFGNESMIRSLVVFLVLYAFILLQGWTSLWIPIMPLITFSFYLFAKSIAVSKENEVSKKTGLRYNPIGDETKVSNRLFFCCILEGLLVLVLGAESLHVPQLIDDYMILYVTGAVIIYIFSLYYVFHDIMYYASISVMVKKNIPDSDAELLNIDEIADLDSNIREGGENKKQKFISYLGIDQFSRLYSIIRLSFLVLLLFWIAMIFLTWFGILPGLQIALPGSDLMEGSLLTMPYAYILVLIAVPFLLIYGFKTVYQSVIKFDEVRLKMILSDFEELDRKKIIQLLNYYSLESQKREPSDI